MGFEFCTRDCYTCLEFNDWQNDFANHLPLETKQYLAKSLKQVMSKKRNHDWLWLLHEMICIIMALVHYSFEAYIAIIYMVVWPCSNYSTASSLFFGKFSDVSYLVVFRNRRPSFRPRQPMSDFDLRTP